MSWREKTGYNLTKKQTIILFSFVLLMTGVAAFGIIRHIVINNLPEQYAHVEIVDTRLRHVYIRSGGSYTRRERPNLFFTFRFQDGSEKEIRIPYEIFPTMQVGDTGILYFRATENSTNWDQRRFISFEKDEQPSMPTSPETEPSTEPIYDVVETS